MTDNKHGAELFDLLRAMEVPRDHHAVFGSGPLLMRGIIDSVNDLDVICRGPAWDRALELGALVALEDGAQIVSCLDGAITFGRSWLYGNFDLDELIDTAEVLNGVPMVGLEHVIAFKQTAGRPKDLAHLRRIERHGGR